MDSRKKAELILEFARSKKAHTPVILDMRKLTDITDYFIITSADSSRRIKAIADGIIEGLSKKDIKVLHIEGNGESGWVLLDCRDSVVHIFQTEKRRFYNLEKLWSDAPRVRVCRKKRARSKKV